ncbi:hypothetical protein HY338_03860 [Candidatus Gottesmanbacteria bacterium]|nr:hypothetical protein [Candidatus Gottesmanbacteria bacterium]
MIDDLLIEFNEHPRFTKEFEKFCKKYHQASLAYRHLRTLLSFHFHPNNKSNPKFSLKVLHRLEDIGPNLTAYKVAMNTKGLSQGQAPRVCFWIRGPLITFLCFGTHIDNYRDSELRKQAKVRIKELDPGVVLQ